MPSLRASGYHVASSSSVLNQVSTPFIPISAACAGRRSLPRYCTVNPGADCASTRLALGENEMKITCLGEKSLYFFSFSMLSAMARFSISSVECLHLEDQHRFGVFLRLSQVLIERRDRFAVLQPVVLELGVGGLVDAFAVDMCVMEDQQFAVRGHVDVEFAAPETGFLALSSAASELRA